MSKVFEIAFKLGGELTSSFKSAFSEASGTMKMLGGAAAALGGTAAFGAMVSQVSEMNDSLAKLSAQTGVYGEDMKELESIAKSVFKQGHGESFDDVTTALMQVKNHMHNLDAGELQRVAGDAMLLANTFDAEVNEVTRAANNMMENFGISSEKAMDLFAAGGQRGLNFSKEMFDNVAEYGPLFAEMGYSAEEYFGILERGAKAGVYNLDYVNDVMKEFQIRSKDGSKKTSDSMKLLSKDTQNVWKDFLVGKGTVSDVANKVVGELKNMDDQVLANQIGVGLFGTKFEDLEADAVYAMLGTSGAMKDFTGSMERINEVRFDTFGAAIRGIGRILMVDVAYPLGETMLPYLNDFASFMSENLPSAIEQTKSTLKTLSPIIVGIGATFATYKAVLMTVAAYQAAFNAVRAITPVLLHAQRTAMYAYIFAGGGLTGVLAAMQSGWAALNVTMAANPIGITIAAIVGLGLALVTAYKMSERFRAVVDNVFGSLKTVVTNAVNYVSTVAPGMWDRFLDSLKEMKVRLFEEMQNIAGKAVDFFGEGITNKVGTVISGFVESFKTGLSSLPGIISLVAPMVTTLGLAFLGVSGPIGWLIGAIVSIGGFLFRLSQTNNGVASSMASAWQSIQTAFAPIMQVLSDGIAQFASEVGPELSKTMGVITSSVVALAPTFAELGWTLAELAVLLVSTWAQVGTTLISTVLPMLLQVFQTVFPLIVSTVSTVIPIVAQVLMAIIPIILQIAQMVIPLILTVVQQVFPMILSIVQVVLPIVAQLLMVVAGVILQIIQTVLPVLLQVVQMVFPIILQVIQMAIPIITIILQTLVTVINGVVIPAIHAILAVVQFVFPLIMMVIQTALTVVNGIIQAAMALLKGDWDGAWNAIRGTAETIMNSIISFFQSINLFEVGKSIVNGLIDGIKSMGGAVIGAVSGMIPEPIRGAASKLLGALPGFADGGIVSSPTLAWVGEGGDTETVIPWNNSQRSKDLWLQTGQALGMLNGSGAFENMKQQIALKTQANDSPPIRPEQVANSVSNQSSQVIQLNYNPQYNVRNSDDLKEVEKHAEKDKDDLEARLAAIARDERRTSFGD